MSNDFILQSEKVGKDKLTFFCDKPNFELEKNLYLDGNEIIVGVDEAGRGALAGPLALGFVIYDKTFFLEKCNDEILNINDSKKHATELAKLLKGYPFTVKLSNLNDFNKLKTASLGKFNLFEKTLNSHNIETCRFFSIGTDIRSQHVTSTAWRSCPATIRLALRDRPFNGAPGPSIPTIPSTIVNAGRTALDSARMDSCRSRLRWHRTLSATESNPFWFLHPRLTAVCTWVLSLGTLMYSWVLSSTGKCNVP